MLQEKHTNKKKNMLKYMGCDGSQHFLFGLTNTHRSKIPGSFSCGHSIGHQFKRCQGCL